MRYTTKWLRAENLGILVAVLAVYAATDASWLLFLALFLVPDVAMAGYLGGARLGALGYNLVHMYLWPVLLVSLGALGIASWALTPGLVWAAHIALDRGLGYGLKEPDSFQHTHLGWIGRPGGGSPGDRPSTPAA